MSIVSNNLLILDSILKEYKKLKSDSLTSAELFELFSCEQVHWFDRSNLEELHRRVVHFVRSLVYLPSSLSAPFFKVFNLILQKKILNFNDGEPLFVFGKKMC